MNIDVAEVLDDFARNAALIGLRGWPAHLDVEHLPAPHRAKALRPGFGAVYIFALRRRDVRGRIRKGAEGRQGWAE